MSRPVEHFGKHYKSIADAHRKTGVAKKYLSKSRNYIGLYRNVADKQNCRNQYCDDQKYIRRRIAMDGLIHCYDMESSQSHRGE